MSDLYQKGNHPDGVRAICKDCSTVTLKDNENEAQKVVDTHDDRMHGGKEVAGVCAWDVQSLAELMPEDPDPDMIAMLADTMSDISPEEMKQHLEHKKARKEVGEL